MGIRQHVARMRGLARSQSGDTIVEVLIAVAIISLILVVAYQTTMRSSNATQDTQEYSAALKVGETQVEFLRDANKLDTDTHQCFKAKRTPNTAAGDCETRPNGPGSDPVYSTRITKENDAYRVDVSWQGLNNPVQLITLYYRPTIVFAGATAFGLSGGGASGEAAIDGGGCGGAGEPACSTGPPPDGEYHYERAFLNVSANDPTHVIGCVWNWGSGLAPSTYGPGSSACLYGVWTSWQTFLPPSPLPPYPAAYLGVPGANAYRYTYSTTVTMKFDNAPDKTSAPSTGYLPDCF